MSDIRAGRTFRWLLALSVSALLLGCAALAILDARLLPWVAADPLGMRPLFAAGTRVLELAGLYPLTEVFLGAMLFAAGLARRRMRGDDRLARGLLVVGGGHVLAKAVTFALKRVLLRPRPFEVLAGTGGVHEFFTRGTSCPSGHATHWVSLWCGLAVVAPRWARVTLPVPLFMMAARVMVLAHWPSDVLFGASVAGVSVWVVARRVLGRAPA